MDTLDSLDVILKDFEETREKFKVSLLPCVQVCNEVLSAAEEQCLDGTHKQQDLDSKVNTQNAKLQQLFNEENHVACERDSLMNAKKDIFDRIQEKQEVFQIQEKKNDSRRKAVSLHEEHFSMKMKSIGASHLLFIFKRIDPVRPDHCCLFQLLVENKVYKVTRCAPELPDVDAMLAELNATNDLHKFVVSMRKRFQQSVCNL